MKKQLLFFVLSLFSLVSYSQISKMNIIPIQTQENPLGYVEYLPKNFDNSGNTKYPILYWLPGLGEIGDGTAQGLNKIYSTGAASWLRKNDVDFIVVMPQSFNGYYGGTPVSSLAKFVTWVNQKYEHVINLGQKHMAGLSSGGYGIRSFIIEDNPVYREFATFTPMSTNFNKANLAEHRQKIIDNNQYIWFHHGTLDKSPNAIGAVRKFHKALYNTDNTRSRLTAYVGGGHNSWHEVYDSSGRNKTKHQGTKDGVTYYDWTSNDETWFDWMLAHGKTLAPVAPSTMSLSNLEINENNAVGELIGTLNSNGTHANFSLVAGAGDDDNSSFNIVGSQLFINVSTDYETKNSYSVRLEVSNDQGVFNQLFTITVTDFNENPSNVKSAKINFGRFNSVEVEGWNNVFQNAPNEENTGNVSLFDDNGFNTTWYLTATNNFNSTPNIAGPVSGNNSSAHPDNAINYAWQNRWGASVVINGLDDTKTYYVEVYPNAHPNTSSTKGGLTQCKINNVFIGSPIDAINNAIDVNETFKAISVSPVSGKITVTISGDNTSTPNLGYLASMVLIEDEVVEETPPAHEIITKINFGRFNSVEVEGWNNVFQNAPNENRVGSFNLQDSQGADTPWYLTATNGFNSTPNIAGPVSGDNSSVHPDNAINYAWQNRWGASVVINGLEDAKTYSLEMFPNAAPNASSTKGGLTKCKVNNTIIGTSIDAINNAVGANDTFVANGVSPVSGKITITFLGDNSASPNLGYLASMIISEDENTSVLPQVTNKEYQTIKNVTKASAIQVYPNPATDYFTINVPNVKVAKLEVYTSYGVRIMSRNLIVGENVFYSNKLTKGINILRIKYSNKVVTKLLIIK